MLGGPRDNRAHISSWVIVGGGGRVPWPLVTCSLPRLQEGWSRCEELWVQQLPLQAREQRGRAQLASLVQEMNRLVADGSEHAILAR